MDSTATIPVAAYEQSTVNEFKWLVEKDNCERKVDADLRDVYEMEFVNNTDVPITGIGMQNNYAFKNGLDKVVKRIKLTVPAHGMKHYVTSDFDCSWQVDEVYCSDGKVYASFSDKFPK